MTRVGFVTHPGRPAAGELAEKTARWLEERGHEARLIEGGAEPVADLDLAVSLGGDGTMLRTVELVCSHRVPVLGVNLGHLGYLTVVEPNGLRRALERFLAGDYGLESRLTLDVSVSDATRPESVQVLHHSALNDVVLQRALPGHTMRSVVSVDSAPFLSFACDALIVATPTGSTAYNMSARGPIVSPGAEVVVLTPVAPHSLFDRSLVFHASQELSILTTGEREADVVVDGWRAATLHPGSRLVCRRGDNDARLVTFGKRDFQQILKSKFHLADR